MDVRFNGGPLDGQTKDVGDEPEDGGMILWPPDATLTDDDAVPGNDNVVEYLYRGNGTADYVSGLLDEG